MAGQSLRGKKIVVTGATGQVGGPVAAALAADNEVYGAARFSDTAARDRLEAAGVRCVAMDLATGDVGALPADADVVLHFAVAKTNDWDRDLQANVAGLAFLMEHHRDAGAFLHCSSAAVYRGADDRAIVETDQLGDNHGVWPFLRTYSICKISAEATARWGAQRFGLPTTIARLSVPYGPQGGWPAVHLEMLINGSDIPVYDGPARYHPIHIDDIVGTVPGLLAAAAVPATVVNWGGPAVSIQEWCTHLGDLTGLTPSFRPTLDTIPSGHLDLTRLDQLVGRTATDWVDWKDGFRDMVAHRHPELLAPA